MNIRCCCEQDAAAYRTVLYTNPYSEAPVHDASVTELVRAQGRVASWGTLLMWRVARACARVSVARRATEEGTEGNSRCTLVLRPPQWVESKSPPECRGFLGGGSKQYRPKNRGRMTVRRVEIGAWVYPIRPHKSMRFGLRKGP